MQIQKYRAIRDWKEAYSMYNFRENVQLWFEIFAFSTFVAAILYPYASEASPMNAAINEELIKLFGVLIFLFFTGVAVLAFMSLAILAWKSIFGEKVKTFEVNEIKILLRQSDQINRALRNYLKTLEAKSGADREKHK